MDEFNSLDGSIFVVRTWDVLISLAMFFPITYYLIPRVLDKGKVKKFIFITLGILVSACVLEMILDWLVVLTFNLPKGANQISDKALKYKEVRQIESNIFYGNLIVFMTSIVIGLSRDWIKKFGNRKLLHKNQLQAELDFLRSQINPHFLFNTLNSLYATSLKDDKKKTSEAILQLSGMMRYMLQDETGQQIGLEDEVDHIENFIKLVLLRFNEDDHLKIELEHDLIPGNIKIAPLLLIPFVENAVKHGITPEGEGNIRIRLITDENKVHFTIYNTLKKSEDSFRSYSGIGLKNVKRRLELLYPESHHLSIEKSENEYSVQLDIDGETIES